MELRLRQSLYSLMPQICCAWPIPSLKRVRLTFSPQVLLESPLSLSPKPRPLSLKLLPLPPDYPMGQILDPLTAPPIVPRLPETPPQFAPDAGPTWLKSKTVTTTEFAQAAELNTSVPYNQRSMGESPTTGLTWSSTSTTTLANIPRSTVPPWTDGPLLPIDLPITEAANGANFTFQVFVTYAETNIVNGIWIDLGLLRSVIDSWAGIRTAALQRWGLDQFSLSQLHSSQSCLITDKERGLLNAEQAEVLLGYEVPLDWYAILTPIDGEELLWSCNAVYTLSCTQDQSRRAHGMRTDDDGYSHGPSKDELILHGAFAGLASDATSTGMPTKYRRSTAPQDNGFTFPPAFVSGAGVEPNDAFSIIDLLQLKKQMRTWTGTQVAAIQPLENSHDLYNYTELPDSLSCLSGEGYIFTPYEVYYLLTALPPNYLALLKPRFGFAGQWYFAYVPSLECPTSAEIFTRDRRSTAPQDDEFTFPPVFFDGSIVSDKENVPITLLELKETMKSWPDPQSAMVYRFGELFGYMELPETLSCLSGGGLWFLDPKEVYTLLEALPADYTYIALLKPRFGFAGQWYLGYTTSLNCPISTSFAAPVDLMNELNKLRQAQTGVEELAAMQLLERHNPAERERTVTSTITAPCNLETVGPASVISTKALLDGP